MQEHHFKVIVPFGAFVDILEALDGVRVAEQSDLHCLCTLPSGAAVIARPAYPDAVDVIVAEREGDAVARGFAARLQSIVARQAANHGQLENA